MKLTSVHLIIFLIFNTLLISCTSTEMDRNEAERSLKVLNSDITNFLNTASGRVEFQVLDFLSNQPDSPVPIKKSGERRVDFSSFDFSEKRGVYVWDRTNNSFSIIGESDLIEIHMDDCIGPGVTFILSEYLDEVESPRRKFPMKINSRILQDNEEIWNLTYSGNLADSMPERIYFQSSGKDYSMEGQLIRSRESNNGTLDVKYSFTYKGNSLIETSIQSTIGYGLHGYFFKQAEVYQRFADHFLKGHFDNEKIDPTSKNYAASFNRHSNLELYENNTMNDRHKKVGDLVLAETEHNEILDYHIRFSNGEEVLFGYYIPVFDELMNFKY